jgi:uncharacterized membrane protein
VDYQMTHQGVRDLDNPIRRHRVNVGPDERALSTLGGAALAGFALGVGGFWEIMLGAAAGTCLIYRGLTGHCSGYAAAGINTAKRRR